MPDLGLMRNASVNHEIFIILYVRDRRDFTPAARLLFLGNGIWPGFDRIRILSEFDDRTTASDEGYASGADYYDR